MALVRTARRTYPRLGLTPVGGTFQTGPNQGCVEGAHAVGVVGAPGSWVCEPDNASGAAADTIYIAKNTPPPQTDASGAYRVTKPAGPMLRCPPGYNPQEIPSGSGNWSCVAAIVASNPDDTGVAQTYTPATKPNAPQVVQATAAPPPPPPPATQPSRQMSAANPSVSIDPPHPSSFTNGGGSGFQFSDGGGVPYGVGGGGAAGESGGVPSWLMIGLFAVAVVLVAKK